MISTVNPATGKKLQDYEETPDASVNEALDEAAGARKEWSRLDFPARAEIIKAAGARLQSGEEEYARLMSYEMGKPLKQARAEIQKCASICCFYADKAAEFLANETVNTEAKKSYVAYEPLGTLLAIMPWNFPFWQVFRAAVPALMAGNTVILKHAANVTGCSQAIEEIFAGAGLSGGVFRSLVIGNQRIKGIIQDDRISAVTLTGSVRAGKAVGSQAGESLKKCVLELGGSDPYLIFEDADIEQAAKTCAYSRLINGGQSCIAAKRFIVVESVREKFEEAFVNEMKKEIMGDPLEETTTVGPLAREDLRDELHRQVEKSVEMGARLLLGGKIPDLQGAFYPPTILSGVRKGMPVFDEETFGPAAAVISARDEEEAVDFANDSEFGLGAAVFTKDREKGERIALGGLKAGACFVNAYVRSDPRLPFGGIKSSGYGRELGEIGIREFTNIKTVYID